MQMVSTKSQQVTHTESLNLVRNLLSTGLSCITYLRCVFGSVRPPPSATSHPGPNSLTSHAFTRRACIRPDRSNLFDESNYDDYPQNGNFVSPKAHFHLPSFHFLNLCNEITSFMCRPDAQESAPQRHQGSGPPARLVSARWT